METQEPVVRVVNFPHYQYVTFWCPMCHTTHTFPAKTEGQVVPFGAIDSHVFTWNNNLVEPDAGQGCVYTIHMQNNEEIHCHIYIRGGKVYGYTTAILPVGNARKVVERRAQIIFSSPLPLIPVSKWPFRPPPNTGTIESATGRNDD